MLNNTLIKKKILYLRKVVTICIVLIVTLSVIVTLKLEEIQYKKAFEDNIQNFAVFIADYTRSAIQDNDYNNLNDLAEKLHIKNDIIYFFVVSSKGRLLYSSITTYDDNSLRNLNDKFSRFLPVADHITLSKAQEPYIKNKIREELLYYTKKADRIKFIYNYLDQVSTPLKVKFLVTTLMNDVSTLESQIEGLKITLKKEKNKNNITDITNKINAKERSILTLTSEIHTLEAYYSYLSAKKQKQKLLQRVSSSEYIYEVTVPINLNYNSKVFLRAGFSDNDSIKVLYDSFLRTILIGLTFLLFSIGITLFLFGRWLKSFDTILTVSEQEK
ncbi:MAG: hypothetical protein AB1782_02895 [Cyanobacteriota bacterium]